MGDKKALKFFTDEELEQELERRNNLTRPESQRDIPWENVIDLAETLVDQIENGEYHEDNDNDHYMYETVMIAIYGNDFFDWFNRKVK